MTEAGKLLLDKAKASRTGEVTIAGQQLVYVIAAIDAEAVAAERARIVAGVKGLPVFAFSLYDDGTDNRLTIGKAAVLRIIEGGSE